MRCLTMVSLSQRRKQMLYFLAFLNFMMAASTMQMTPLWALGALVVGVILLITQVAISIMEIRS
jgi:uncharacterized membrane protein YdbT with pleckstrin-like domain